MVRVLIIEDDPMVAEINRQYICRVDEFSVAGLAYNGWEPSHFLQSHDVDLILLDVFMPQNGWHHAATELKGNTLKSTSS